MRARLSVKSLTAAILATALTACATAPAPLPPAEEPTGGFNPSGSLELGDYAKQPEGAILKAFSDEVVGRYAAGAPMEGVLKDLKDNKFDCSASKAAAGGAPPDQVCRHTIKANGCDYTWQVHLFDDDAGKATVSRVRGLYDKACGGDDLLGG